MSIYQIVCCLVLAASEATPDEQCVLFETHTKSGAVPSEYFPGVVPRVSCIGSGSKPRVVNIEVQFAGDRDRKSKGFLVRYPGLCKGDKFPIARHVLAVEYFSEQSSGYQAVEFRERRKDLLGTKFHESVAVCESVGNRFAGLYAANTSLVVSEVRKDPSGVVEARIVVSGLAHPVTTNARVGDEIAFEDSVLKVSSITTADQSKSSYGWVVFDRTLK